MTWTPCVGRASVWLGRHVSVEPRRPIPSRCWFISMWSDTRRQHKHVKQWLLSSFICIVFNGKNVLFVNKIFIVNNYPLLFLPFVLHIVRIPNQYIGRVRSNIYYMHQMYVPPPYQNFGNGLCYSLVSDFVFINMLYLHMVGVFFPLSMNDPFSILN